MRDNDMKHTTILIGVALVSFGCGQPGQAPPAASASPAAAAPAATVTAPPRTSTSQATQPTRVPSDPVPPPSRETSERVRYIVPDGTKLPVELESTVSTDTAREGDQVLATLTEDVPLKGFTLDKGTEVRGQVVTAIAAKRVKGRARLVIAFDSVMENGERLSIRTEDVDTMAKSSKSKDKKIIAGGAIGGLIVGALKDGKKGAAIGTLAGAAAGTGAVLVMKGDEVELPRGAKLVLEVVR
jgi:hypothetical protein